jgi:hypothetical protein
VGGVCGAETASGGRCRRKGTQDGGRCTLHAVKPTETLVQAAQSGDRTRTLQALRDRLAEEVERVADDGFCPHCKRGSSSVAPVAKQLRDVLGELAELSPVVRKDPVRDELERRRAARKPAAV